MKYAKVYTEDACVDVETILDAIDIVGGRQAADSWYDQLHEYVQKLLKSPLDKPTISIPEGTFFVYRPYDWRYELIYYVEDSKVHIIRIRPYKYVG